MKYADFIDKVATKAGESKASTRRVMDAVADVIKNLPVGDRLIIRGFGTFKKVRTKSRNAKLKGITYTVPSKQVIRFKASK